MKLSPLASVCSAALVLSSAGLACAAATHRKVLIIGVDGLRPDALIAANTPSFDGLIAAGAVSYRCSAEDITVSGPGWSSILTGVHRTKHLVVDNTFASPNYADYPHFFRRLQDLCDASTASIVHWTPINSIICGTNSDYTLSGVSDADVATAAVNLLGSGNPDVVFICFDDCDAAGHGYGFSPTVPEYLAAIARTDGHAGRVLAAMRARATFADEDWLVIVTSDHGGTPDGSHGQNIPEHRLTPLIVSGLSSAVGTTITPDPEIVDTPATVMTFLGLPIEPAWGWDGEPVGLDMENSTSDPFECAPPPPPPLGACCLPNGACVQLTLAECTQRRGTWAGLDAECPPGGCGVPSTILFESFEAVVLGPNVDESTAGANVWSPTPPSGWSVDRSGVPAGGVTEWRGWSVASRTWWTQTAADQNRSLFTRGVGAVAVADPDEWDDLPHDAGTYNTSMSTRPISLAGMKPGSARLFLDSSWRPWADQTATISVRFDGGAPLTIARWTSSGPDFKPDAENETLAFTLPNPVGAEEMELTFSLTNAGNDWWWALDNVQVTALPRVPTRVLLIEDFESVPLGPNVDETLAGEHVWSGEPPAGWVFDDTGVVGFDNPALGVTEWKGWAVASRAWWTQIAGDQNRSQFTRGVGAVAVADPDEWDDKGAPSSIGAYNARMLTPRVALAGIDAGSLRLAFDSSWRYEGAQRAKVVATFSTGAQSTVLEWTSSSGPNFKPDATNEHVELPVPTPPDAAWVELSFNLLDARNNWWWAIDNLLLTCKESVCGADFNQDGSADFFDYLDFVAAFDAESTAADFNGDGSVDFFDYLDFVAAFDSGCE